MLEWEFDPAVKHYWENWKDFPSFKELTKKNRKTIEEIIKSYSKNQRKGHTISVVEVAETYLRLIAIITAEKWSEHKKEHRVDIFTKCDNFFHKVKVAFESLKAFVQMNEFNEAGLVTDDVHHTIATVEREIGSYGEKLQKGS